MKSINAASTAGWDRRVLNLSIAAMMMALAGRVQAGPISAMPAGEGAVRAWSVPYNPVSPGMMTGLQGFMKTDLGARLLAEVPSLSIIGRLNPDSEIHRRIVGALGLPVGLEAQLQIPENQASALGTILSAYTRSENKINGAVQARAKEIVAAVSQGRINATQLSNAASELAPFSSISPAAESVGKMANAARSQNTMAAAQEIAAKFASGKDAEAVDSVPAGVPNMAPKTGAEGELQAAQRDLRELAGFEHNLTYAESAVSRLKIRGENTQDEAVQRVIAKGLVADLTGAVTPKFSRRFANAFSGISEYKTSLGYSLQVVDALKGIADKSSFDSVKEVAIQGIMDDILRTPNLAYSQYALDVVEYVANRSASQQVKNLAVSLMRREMGKHQKDSSYSELIQGKIANISRPGGGYSLPPSIISPSQYPF